MPNLSQALGSTGLPDIGKALSPENLAQGFTQGMQAGGPLSQGTEALGNAISQGAQNFNAQNMAHPPLAYQPEFSTPSGTLSASTAPSSGGYFEAAPAPAVAAAPPTAAAPVAAAPISAAAPTSAAPMAPAGPLPAYGSDLRPATPTIAAPPPMAPLASAPTSAAVTSASAGPGGLAQPAVVSKSPAAPAAATSPAVGLTETGSAAVASGAAAGALATQNADKARLRRLVESVARQQPQLRWAAADLDDGTTLLVTDLASGWIPHGVEIPTGVSVLPPEHRHGGLEKLLRSAILIETWTPGQYLPEPDKEPVAMSLRARDLPAIEDLHWQLTQATNWRDGLPQLAHTVTKAAIAGTGILEAETDMLKQHLHTTAQMVLSTYPNASADAVGNWQLLSAIDALINGHRTALNYHFAWFQALHTTTHGG